GPLDGPGLAQHEAHPGHALLVEQGDHDRALVGRVGVDPVPEPGVGEEAAPQRHVREAPHPGELAYARRLLVADAILQLVDGDLESLDILEAAGEAVLPSDAPEV